MTEVRRARILCELEQISNSRDRLRRIRDDEDKALRGEVLYGTGDQEASDLLAEVGFVLLVAIDKLQKAKKCSA